MSIGVKNIESCLDIITHGTDSGENKRSLDALIASSISKAESDTQSGKGLTRAEALLDIFFELNKRLKSVTPSRVSRFFHARTKKIDRLQQSIDYVQAKIEDLINKEQGLQDICITISNYLLRDRRSFNPDMLQKLSPSIFEKIDLNRILHQLCDRSWNLESKEDVSSPLLSSSTAVSQKNEQAKKTIEKILLVMIKLYESNGSYRAAIDKNNSFWNFFHTVLASNEIFWQTSEFYFNGYHHASKKTSILFEQPIFKALCASPSFRRKLIEKNNPHKAYLTTGQGYRTYYLENPNSYDMYHDTDPLGDKLILDVHNESLSWMEQTKQFRKAFPGDMLALASDPLAIVRDIVKFPKANENIIIDIIKNFSSFPLPEKDEKRGKPDVKGVIKDRVALASNLFYFYYRDMTVIKSVRHSIDIPMGHNYLSLKTQSNVLESRINWFMKFGADPMFMMHLLHNLVLEYPGYRTFGSYSRDFETTKWHGIEKERWDLYCHVIPNMQNIMNYLFKYIPEENLADSVIFKEILTGIKTRYNAEQVQRFYNYLYPKAHNESLQQTIQELLSPIAPQSQHSASSTMPRP